MERCLYASEEFWVCEQLLIAFVTAVGRWSFLDVHMAMYLCGVGGVGFVKGGHLIRNLFETLLKGQSVS